MNGRRMPSTVGAILACIAFAVLFGAAASAVPGTARSTATEAAIQIRPTSGPGGTVVAVRGDGFSPNGCRITISFRDADLTFTELKDLKPASGFKTRVRIPLGAAVGTGTVEARQHSLDPHHGKCAPFYVALESATFTVTEPGRWLR
jgi:hypothetical protein